MAQPQLCALYGQRYLQVGNNGASPDTPHTLSPGITLQCKAKKCAQCTDSTAKHCLKCQDMYGLVDGRCVKCITPKGNRSCSRCDGDPRTCQECMQWDWSVSLLDPRTKSCVTFPADWDKPSGWIYHVHKLDWYYQ